VGPLGPRLPVGWAPAEEAGSSGTRGSFARRVEPQASRACSA
jgi:hypothetical protein